MVFVPRGRRPSGGEHPAAGGRGGDGGGRWEGRVRWALYLKAPKCYFWKEVIGDGFWVPVTTRSAIVGPVVMCGLWAMAPTHYLLCTGKKWESVGVGGHGNTVKCECAGLGPWHLTEPRQVPKSPSASLPSRVSAATMFCLQPIVQSLWSRRGGSVQNPWLRPPQLPSPCLKDPGTPQRGLLSCPYGSASCVLHGRAYDLQLSVQAWGSEEPGVTFSFTPPAAPPASSGADMQISP